MLICNTVTHFVNTNNMVRPGQVSKLPIYIHDLGRSVNCLYIHDLGRSVNCLYIRIINVA